MSTLTRRGFIKGAAGAGTAVGAGLLANRGATVAASAEESTVYTPAERTAEVDVLVIGLGTSGLTAAVGAADKGASVVAIDSAETMALTTNCLTSGAWCVESTEQLKWPHYMTQQEAYEHVLKGASYINSARCLRSIVANSGRAIDILIDGGMPFVFPFEGSDETTDWLSRGGHVYNADAETRAGVFASILLVGKGALGALGGAGCRTERSALPGRSRFFGFVFNGSGSHIGFGSRAKRASRHLPGLLIIKQDGRLPREGEP